MADAPVPLPSGEGGASGEAGGTEGGFWGALEKALKDANHAIDRHNHESTPGNSQLGGLTGTAGPIPIAAGGGAASGAHAHAAWTAHFGLLDPGLLIGAVGIAAAVALAAAAIEADDKWDKADQERARRDPAYALERIQRLTAQREQNISKWQPGIGWNH